MLPAGWSGLVLLLASLQACFTYIALLLLLQRRSSICNSRKQTATSSLLAMSTSAVAVCKACSARLQSRSSWYKPAHWCQLAARTAAAAAAGAGAATAPQGHLSSPCTSSFVTASLPTPEQLANLISCRRSIYPKHMTGEIVSRRDITALLEAANWAPTHGKTEPWRFVVLGRQGMQAMQDVTEAVYRVKLAGQPEQLQETLNQLQQDRLHRWSTPSHMIAICMARQPHPNKLMPLWEELSACACAVQNIHLMATSLNLAAYWSSWHDEARDSPQMLQYLGMDSAKGDRCWGFLVLGVVQPEVAQSYRASRGPLDHKVVFRE